MLLDPSIPEIFFFLHFTTQFVFFTVALRYKVEPGFDVKNVWWRILDKYV